MPEDENTTAIEDGNEGADKRSAASSRRSSRARKTKSEEEKEGGVLDGGANDVVEGKKEVKKGGGTKRSRKQNDRESTEKVEEDQGQTEELAAKKAKSEQEDGSEVKKTTAMLVPSKKAKWKEGDTIYGLNRDDLYIAKVLKVRTDFKRGFPVWQYFLHYQGWAKKWDEWLNEEHTYSNTDKTREIQKEMKEANRARQEAAKKLKKQKGEAAKEQKPESHSNIDFDAVEVTDKPYKLTIPNVLQRRMLDDLDMIEDRKLVHLPRTPTVHAVMEEFLKSKGAQASRDAALVDMIEGLEVYFDKALGTMLLYEFELVQYRKICSETPNFSPSQMYGCEHLLRLFVKLPLMLREAEVPTAQAQALQPRIAELLKFLEKNVEQYCVAIYDPADLEYVEMVQRATAT